MLFLTKSLEQMDVNPWLVIMEENFSDLWNYRTACKIGSW